MGVTVELRWRRLPRWRRGLAVLLAVAGVGFAALFVSVALDDSSSRESGMLARARVIDVHSEPKGSTMAEIRFVASNGETISTQIEVRDATPFPSSGDLMDVRYRPEDPSGTVVVAHVHRISYWVGMLMWSVLSVLALLPAWWVSGVAVRRRRPRSLDAFLSQTDPDGI